MGGNGAQQRETVDLDMVSRIRQEAFHRSQVMDTFSYLTERIGPRLTNSPAMGRANAWTRGKFNEWKLDNVHDEAFDDFGRGWEFTSASVEMLGDRVQPLHALPRPGRRAPGPVEGELVQVEIKKPEDIEKYRGKLRDKILLLGQAREYKRGTEPDSHRHDATSLEGLQEFTLPKDKDATAERAKRVKEYQERQHQRGDDGHGRAADEFRQRRARHERDARRPGLRPGQQARDPVDLRPGAADRSPVCRKRRVAGGVCMRRTTRCARPWCRSTRSTRSPS